MFLSISCIYILLDRFLLFLYFIDSISRKKSHSSGLTRGSCQCKLKLRRSLYKQSNPLAKQNIRFSAFSFDEQNNYNVNSNLETFDNEDKSFHDVFCDQNKLCGCTLLPLRRSLSWPLILSECERVSIMDDWEVWDMSDEETDSTKLSDDSTTGKQPSLLDEERTEKPESPLINRRVSVRTSFNGDSNMDISKSFNSDDSQLLEEVKTVYVFKGSSNNNKSIENLTKSCDLSAPTKKQSFRDAFRERLSVNFGTSTFSKSKSMESLRSINETKDDHLEKNGRNISTTHSDLTAMYREENETDNDVRNDVFLSSNEEIRHQQHDSSKDNKNKHRGNLSLNVPTFTRARSLTDTSSKSNEDVYVLTVPTLSRAQSAEEITRASSVDHNVRTDIKNHRPLSKTQSGGNAINDTTRKTLVDKPRKKKSIDNNAIPTRDSGYLSLDETRKHSLENDSSVNLSYKIVFTPEQSNNEEEPKQSESEKSKHSTPPHANHQSLTSLQQGMLPLIAVGLGEERESDHVISSVTSPHSVEEHGNFHLGVHQNSGREKHLSVSEEDEYVDINFSVDEWGGEGENESSLDGIQELEQSSDDNNKNFENEHEQPSFHSLDSSTPVKIKHSLSGEQCIDTNDDATTKQEQLKSWDVSHSENSMEDNNKDTKVFNSPVNDKHSECLSEDQQPMICINGVVQNTNEIDSNIKTLSGDTDNNETEEYSLRMEHPLDIIGDPSTEAFDSLDSSNGARKASLDTSWSSPLEDSLTSFEAHEHECLVNGGDDAVRPELSTEEEFESMYRDALDGDSIDFKRGSGYLPTISEISTEAENQGRV